MYDKTHECINSRNTDNLEVTLFSHHSKRAPLGRNNSHYPKSIDLDAKLMKRAVIWVLEVIPISFKYKLERK